MKAPLALLGRVLAVSWAGFWMFFFVAESWSWHAPLGLALLWFGAGLLFVFLAVVPWHWERRGGVCLCWPDAPPGSRTRSGHRRTCRLSAAS